PLRHPHPLAGRGRVGTLPATGHDRQDPVPPSRRPADGGPAGTDRAARRQRFMSVSAQHAALLLAQGAGRLIRSDQDRGMVAVLDPRLATARYGSVLRESMPPLWPTADPEVALAALRRLADG